MNTLCVLADSGRWQGAWIKAWRRTSRWPWRNKWLEAMKIWRQSSADSCRTRRRSFSRICCSTHVVCYCESSRYSCKTSRRSSNRTCCSTRGVCYCELSRDSEQGDPPAEHDVVHVVCAIVSYLQIPARWADPPHGMCYCELSADSCKTKRKSFSRRTCCSTSESFGYSHRTSRRSSSRTCCSTRGMC